MYIHDGERRHPGQARRTRSHSFSRSRPMRLSVSFSMARLEGRVRLDTAAWDSSRAISTIDEDYQRSAQVQTSVGEEKKKKKKYIP
jgi:hypothetical protein